MIDEREGVIKFRAVHETKTLDLRSLGDALRSLSGWREVLRAVGLVGRDPGREGGAAFGNLSARRGPPSSGRGRRSFVITGTQTGGNEQLGASDFCVVGRYDIAANTVWSHGPIEPSSESMSHGAIYDLSPAIRFVFHGHSPTIWERARELRLPTTASHVAYGTAKMAVEIARLYRESALPSRQILAMGGHRDGVIVFGKTAEDAGRALIAALARATAAGVRF